ncbi:hypothetical protein C5H24_12685, partial [Xylella fastidiosa]
LHVQCHFANLHYLLQFRTLPLIHLVMILSLLLLERELDHALNIPFPSLFLMTVYLLRIVLLFRLFLLYLFHRIDRMHS